MDAAIIALTSNVISILLPYVTKSAEEIATKVGDDVYNKAKGVLSTLKKTWSDDPVAAADLTRFEKNPQIYEPVLAQTLQEKLSEDKNLIDELTRYIQQIGPALEIFQRMDEGKNVVGLEAKEFISGSAQVTQEIKSANGVTGAKIDTLG